MTGDWYDAEKDSNKKIVLKSYIKKIPFLTTDNEWNMRSKSHINLDIYLDSTTYQI